MAKSGVYDFDKTAANNTDVAGTALTVGAMPPSNVGPAFRAIMAILKKWQEDTGGALTTTGSANAYVLDVNSNPYASSATYADGDTFAFIANFTNTGAATLNVESEGAKAIRKKNDLALVAGDIVSGSMYTVHYDASANGAAGAWILDSDADRQSVSGNYTPTASATVNLDSTPTGSARTSYMRVGDIVTVAGAIAVDPTVTTDTSFELSLPIASNFANGADCSGVGTIYSAASTIEAVRITASAANDTAVFSWFTGYSSSVTITFIFQYTILA